MDALKQDYRGHTITVIPMQDQDDLWDFEYHLAKEGAAVAPQEASGITRIQTLGGYATAEVACMAGMEVAKIEVDNLLAFDSK